MLWQFAVSQQEGALDILGNFYGKAFNNREVILMSFSLQFGHPLLPFSHMKKTGSLREEGTYLIMKLGPDSWDRSGVGSGWEGQVGMASVPRLTWLPPVCCFRKSSRNSRPLRPKKGLGKLCKAIPAILENPNERLLSVGLRVHCAYF